MRQGHHKQQIAISKQNVVGEESKERRPLGLQCNTHQNDHLGLQVYFILFKKRLQMMPYVVSCCSHHFNMLRNPKTDYMSSYVF